LPNAEKERAIHLELPIGRKSPGQSLRAPLELAALERASRGGDSPERDAEIV
jgi:hypothetical protein